MPGSFARPLRSCSRSRGLPPGFGESLLNDARLGPVAHAGREDSPQAICLRLIQSGCIPGAHRPSGARHDVVLDRGSRHQSRVAIGRKRLVAAAAGHLLALDDLLSVDPARIHQRLWPIPTHAVGLVADRRIGVDGDDPVIELRQGPCKDVRLEGEQRAALAQAVLRQDDVVVGITVRGCEPRSRAVGVVLEMRIAGLPVVRPRPIVDDRDLVQSKPAVMRAAPAASESIDASLGNPVTASLSAVDHETDVSRLAQSK